MSPDLFDDPPPSPKEAGRTHYCPRCRSPMRRIDGRMGPFWGCSAWPECRMRLHDKDGRPSTTPDERFRCPVCTRPLAKASNDKGVYWYCIGYNKGCRAVLADEDGRPERAWRCGDCGQLLKRRHGRKGVFWGCSRYPDCTRTYPDDDGKPLMPDTRER